MLKTGCRSTDDGEELPIDHSHGHKALRFSLAGVQLEFSALEENRRGLTIPAEGIGGSWIIKLPSPEFADVPENEYAMMTLARLIGMDVPTIHLANVDDIDNPPSGLDYLKGRQAYAIERFDRLSDGTAVHTEDFARVFGVYPDDQGPLRVSRSQEFAAFSEDELSHLAAKAMLP